MIVTLLLITLSFSFCFQFLVIILYVSNRTEIYFKLFLGTFITNTLLMIILSIAAIRTPEEVMRVDITLVVWLLSGFVMIFILFMKINIFVKIFRRTKDPQLYEINYFGKKVYKKGIIKQSEFVTFILAIPFFLLAGAYFIARLTNLILYGHI